MKRFLTFLTLACLLFTTGHLHGGSREASVLPWQTDFKKAQEIAKEENKPILMFFTGSDWCGWCHKLQREVLTTEEFVERVSDEFVFVEIDFPRRHTLSPTLTAQNRMLSRQYSVRGFPTILILDPDSNPVMVTGYKDGGGKKYAKHLLDKVKEYKALSQKLSSANIKSTTAEELETLFGEARRRGDENSLNRILALGLEKGDNGFFLTEKYRREVEAGRIGTPEAKKLKERLLEKEADNKEEASYRIAVIEFQGLVEQLDPQEGPSRAVAPLLTYLQSYDHLNLENEWKIHLTISQVFRSKGRLEDALDFSKKALEVAPEDFKSEIKETISGIETGIDKLAQDRAA